MTNKQRLSALMGKLNPAFLKRWRECKGLTGTSKDKRQFVLEKDGKSYLIVEREHRGSRSFHRWGGKFLTVSVYILNESTGELNYVKAADSYELAKLNPCK